MFPAFDPANVSHLCSRTNLAYILLSIFVQGSPHAKNIMRPIYERYRQVKRLLGAAGQSGDDLQFARDGPSIDTLRGQLHSPFNAPSAPGPRTAATRPDSATTAAKEKRSHPVCEASPRHLEAFTCQNIHMSHLMAITYRCIQTSC